MIFITDLFICWFTSISLLFRCPTDFWTGEVTQGSLEHVKCDVTDLTSLTRAMKGAAAVIHTGEARIWKKLGALQVEIFIMLIIS